MTVRQALGATLLAIPAAAVASGYEVNTQSAAATGQGGAVSASVSGPESIFYNPAGLVNIGGIAATLGVTTLVPTVGYTGTQSGNTALETRVLVPASAFVAASLNKDLAVGLGFYQPVAFDVEWPSNFDARYDATSMYISSYTLAPTIAYRVLPEISLGLGVTVTRMTLLNERAVNFIDTDGTLLVGGGGWTAGVNAGVQATLLNHRLNFGVAFRTGSTVPINGRAEFQTPVEFQQVLPDQPMTTNVDLPGDLIFAVSGVPFRRAHFGDWRPTLTVSFEASIGFWPNHAAWQVNFPNQPSLDLSEPRAYVNPMSFRAGAELAVTDAVRVRLGGGYEPSATQSTGAMPSMPDGDHYYASIGLGYALTIGWRESGQHVFFDVAYSYVAVSTLTSAPPAYPAAYSGHTQVIGLSISAQWPP
jgi:long-chain fatty acid transport protein